MTSANDNRTTELLRKLLDERGVEWADQFGPFPVTAYEGDGVTWIAKEYTAGKFSIETRPVTPEQAIVATLGSGTLTAEQVMAIAGKHQPDYCSDTHVCFDWQAIADELNDMLGSDNEYEAKMDELLCYLTNGKFSKSRQYSLDFMKACVDEEYEDAYNELNAELGSGACEIECFDDGADEGMDGEWFSYAPPTWYLSCGHTAQGTEKPNFCHVCGKAVE